MPLEREIEYFDSQLSSWLTQYRGKFALVKDATLIGVFSSPEEALAEGARRFGRGPFLIRLVVERQAEISVPALALGIINARVPHPA